MVVGTGDAVTVEPLIGVTPADQVYVLAPLAIKVAVPLVQMVELFTVIVGLGITVTVDTAVLVQPFTEPVTV